MRFAFRTIPNALRALLRLVRAPFRREDKILADDYVVHVRRARCAMCPFEQFKQCTRCTCFVDLKTFLATEECPDGRWRKQTHTSDGL